MSFSVFDASSALRRLAEPRPVGDSVKAAILRASRKVKWPYSRVRDIWYRDPRIKISAGECDQLRSHLDKLKLDLCRQNLTQAELLKKAINNNDLNGIRIHDELKVALDAISAVLDNIDSQHS